MTGNAAAPNNSRVPRTLRVVLPLRGAWLARRYGLTRRHRLARWDCRVIVRADRLQLTAIEGTRAIEAAEALAVPLHALLGEERVTVIAAHSEQHR